MNTQETVVGVCSLVDGPSKTVKSKYARVRRGGGRLNLIQPDDPPESIDEALISNLQTVAQEVNSRYSIH